MAYLKTKMNSKKPALTITRAAVKEKKLVYVGCANKSIRYKYGRSKIVYIGTTTNGAWRIATSAALKAERFLTKHGIKHLDFFVVVSQKRPNVSTWRALESSLLLTFRSIYGEIPQANKQGAKMSNKKMSKYYREEYLKKIILKLEK